MGRNMHDKEYNLEPLAKFSDLIPSFGAFSAWLDNMFETSYRKEINDYLATSVDIYDLERKMQNLYRRGVV